MPPPTPDNLSLQIVWLLVLAVPVACIAWTVTHEEIFREPREWAQRKCETSSSMLARKFFYLFTCEYCFSHYVTLAFLALTQFRLLIDDWRGYIISFFAVVWIANAYMSAFQRLRVDIRKERAEAKLKEQAAPRDNDANDAPKRDAASTDGSTQRRPRVRAHRG